MPRRLLGWLSIGLACGCGPRLGKLPVFEPAAVDGEQLAPPPPVQFAVTGIASTDADALIADLNRHDLAFVASLGLVDHASTRAWKRWTAQWRALSAPIVAVPSHGDHRGDRTLEAFRHVFPGAGVRELGLEVAWHHFDLRSEASTWRFVVLESDAESPTLQEQQFWVPKVSSPGDDFDKLVVFAGAPPRTLSRATTHAEAVSTLLGAVRDHGDVLELMGIFAGGSYTNEVQFPGGEWGEIQVIAGLGSGPGADLRRVGWVGDERLTLQPDFDAALAAEAELRFRDDPSLATPIDQEWPASALPVRGWWLVTLHGAAMEVAFRIERPDGTFHPLYRTNYHPDHGWKTGSWEPSR